MTENNKIEIVLSLNGKQYRADVVGATKDTDKFSASTDKSAASIAHMNTAVKLASGVFAALLIRQLSAATKAATLLAARNETLGVTLTAVGRNAGFTTSEMFGYAEAVEQMGITTQVARQIVVRMTQAQLDLNQASKLARVAQDAAVIGNINSSQALDRLLNGIVTLQPEILRGIGITVSFEQEYAKFARTVGRTADSLTQNEKQQIAFNAAMREGEKISGTYESALDTAGKQLGSWERDLEELSAAFGARFLPMLSRSIPLVREFTQAITEWVQPDSIRPLAELREELASLNTAFESAAPRQRGALSNRIKDLQAVIAEMELARGESDALTVRLKALDQQIEDMQSKQQGLDSRLETARAGNQRGRVDPRRVSRLVVRQQQINNQLQTALDQREQIARRLTDVSQDALNADLDKLFSDNDALFAFDSVTDNSAKKQQQRIDKLIRNMEREIALFGETSNAAAIRYDLETDALGNVTQAQESLLVKRAQDLDSLVAINDQLDAFINHNDELFAFEQLEPSLTRAEQQIQAFADQAARNIQGALADFLFDPFDDGLDGMVEKFADTVQRMAAEVAAAQVLSAAFGSTGLSGGLGNLLGVGAGADLDRFMSNSELFAFHSGGIVGQEGVSFAHAKRLHSGGLASDEVPAILKKDEGVFTQGQMRALGSAQPVVNVNLYQDASRAGEVKQTNTNDGVNLDIFVSEIEGRMTQSVLAMGDVGQAISSRFGLNPAAGAT